MLKKIKTFFLNPEKRMIFLAQHGFYNNMDDELFLKKQFKNVFGYELNLDSPETFNEKLQWLKLYNRKAEYTTFVDKYEVKQYVSDTIGAEYLIKNIGVWDKFEEIDFSKLPNQFVLKCTHDSGGLIICKNKEKLNLEKARKKINQALKRNYYYQNREWPYKNVKPRIICEEYMSDEKQQDLLDYKFLCYNGKVEASFVCSERRSNNGLAVDFFDRDWNHIPVKRHYRNADIVPMKPINYDIMIKLAEKLSRDIPFVRVDFYEINERIYFGEMTFYPGSGFEEFTPKEYDYFFGKKLKLPERSL